MTRRTVLACCLASFASGTLAGLAADRARRAFRSRSRAHSPSPLGPESPVAPASGRRRCVVTGNSLAAGSFLPPGLGFADRLAADLGPAWQVVPRAAGGQTTGELIDRAGRLRGLREPGAVLVVWEGTNDLFFGAAGAEAAHHLEAYGRARRAEGWRVVVLTVLPRLEPGTPTDFEAGRAVVNGRLRRAWPTFADGLVDVAADPRIGRPDAPLDRRYYLPDAVHLTPLGAAVAADLTAGAVLGLGPGAAHGNSPSMAVRKIPAAMALPAAFRWTPSW